MDDKVNYSVFFPLCADCTEAKPQVMRQILKKSVHTIFFSFLILLRVSNIVPAGPSFFF